MNTEYKITDRLADAASAAFTKAKEVNSEYVACDRSCPVLLIVSALAKGIGSRIGWVRWPCRDLVRWRLVHGERVQHWTRSEPKWTGRGPLRLDDQQISRKKCTLFIRTRTDSPSAVFLSFQNTKII
jgi:hypothetical protein